jgi:hypothetical protein
VDPTRSTSRSELLRPHETGTVVDDDRSSD